MLSHYICWFGAVWFGSFVGWFHLEHWWNNEYAYRHTILDNSFQFNRIDWLFCQQPKYIWVEWNWSSDPLNEISQWSHSDMHCIESRHQFNQYFIPSFERITVKSSKSNNKICAHCMGSNQVKANLIPHSIILVSMIKSSIFGCAQ